MPLSTRWRPVRVLEVAPHQCMARLSWPAQSTTACSLRAATKGVWLMFHADVEPYLSRTTRGRFCSEHREVGLDSCRRYRRTEPATAQLQPAAARLMLRCMTTHTHRRARILSVQVERPLVCTLFSNAAGAAFKLGYFRN
jgi:hypothetical protein